jgi:hypothetical protein
MNLDQLKRIFSDFGCRQIYVKSLSANDNSKNQVYLSGSFDLLNILPISEIKADSSGDWKTDRFKASIRFSWIGEDGELYVAPKSQLILYPNYPEVRFSGFLQSCKNAPSLLMTKRLPDRLLFLGVSDTGTTLGYVAAPESEIASEFNTRDSYPEYGVFKILILKGAENNRARLLAQLKRIHLLNWIVSKRLNSKSQVLPCNSSNCGGYTLEAELGITPNGYSEPDYLGWEVKQFSVSNFERIKSSVITLMTPEPTGGFYVSSGVDAFITKYGYKDKTGRPDRLNFGGIHKVNFKHPTTELKLVLIGYDFDSEKITNSSGKISLIDNKENEVASWSFSSLILHWNKKHNQACYVPSLSEIKPVRRYWYGNNIILGSNTDFQLFLKQMSIGNIYYDPGIKMESVSSARKIKRRSQFRIKSEHLPSLYKKSEIVNDVDHKTI